MTSVVPYSPPPLPVEEFTAEQDTIFQDMTSVWIFIIEQIRKLYKVYNGGNGNALIRSNRSSGEVADTIITIEFISMILTLLLGFVAVASQNDFKEMSAAIQLFFSRKGAIPFYMFLTILYFTTVYIKKISWTLSKATTTLVSYSEPLGDMLFILTYVFPEIELLKEGKNAMSIIKIGNKSDIDALMIFIGKKFLAKAQSKAVKHAELARLIGKYGEKLKKYLPLLMNKGGTRRKRKVYRHKRVYSRLRGKKLKVYS
jgi:hypothetical protein